MANTPKVKSPMYELLAGMDPYDRWSAFMAVASHINPSDYPQVLVTVPDLSVNAWQQAIHQGNQASFADWAFAEVDSTDVLACPHKGCDGTEFFALDTCTRASRLEGPTLDDDGEQLHLSVEDVDSNFQTVGYQCQTCRRPVSMPAQEVLEVDWT